MYSVRFIKLFPPLYSSSYIVCVLFRRATVEEIIARINVNPSKICTLHRRAFAVITRSLCLVVMIGFVIKLS